MATAGEDRERIRRLTEQIGRGGGGAAPPPLDVAQVRQLTANIGRGLTPEQQMIAQLRGGLPEALIHGEQNPLASFVAGETASRPVTARQLAAMDPEVVKFFGDEFGRIADEFEYPVTARGLRRLGVTAPNQNASIAWGGDLGPREWALQVPAGRNLSNLVEDTRLAQTLGYFPGGVQTVGGLNQSGFIDPLQQTAAHEFGHAIDRSYYDWARANQTRPGVTRAYQQYADLRDQLGRMSLQRLGPSGYSQQEAGKVLNMAAAGDLEARSVRKLMSLGENISPQQYKALPVKIRQAIAREPLAEVMSMRFLGKTNKPLGSEWLPETKRALAYVPDLEEVDNVLRGAGYRGAVRVPTALRGTAAFAAPLLAPVIADRLPEPIRPTAQAAITGAGIGSLAGGRGALVGAGVGAAFQGLGGLLKQAFD